jgi:Ni/Co efflux regulator RcnB
MKTFLLTLAAASAITAAALPAAAQPYADHGRDSVRERTIAQGDNLQWRIDRAERDGRIGHRSADRLREQLRVADRLSRTYRRDGVLTRMERADLDRRYDAIGDSLRRLSRDDRRDHDRRW